MIERERLQRLLVRAETPSLPERVFADALGEELLASDRAGDVREVGTRPPSQRGDRQRARRVRLGVVAAAATLLVAATVATVPSGSDGELRTTAAEGREESTTAATQSSTALPAALDETAAADACSRFRATAFGPLTRSNVLGQLNAQHLTDRTSALVAIDRLRQALDHLAGELAAAGAPNDLIAEVRSRSAILARVAESPSPRAATFSSALREFEVRLLHLDQQLIAGGVGQCL